MRAYHGTQYHEFIKKNGLDISKSYGARNDSLGAGRAAYLSYDHRVAADYSTANANESFHPSIIEELREHDEVAAFLLESLYGHGTDRAWSMLEEMIKGAHGLEDERDVWTFLSARYSERDYDLNDVQDIAEWIRGSKVLEESDYAEESPASLFGGGGFQMPLPVKEDARKMGIRTIPSDYGEVLVYDISPAAKIKKIGFTQDAPAEAAKARKEGFDGLEFTNSHSVDGAVELAIFNVSVLERLDLVEDAVPFEELDFASFRAVFDSLHSGCADVESILEASFHPGLLDWKRRASQECLKTILENMIRFKVVDVTKDGFKPLVSKVWLESGLIDYRLSTGSSLADNLLKTAPKNDYKRNLVPPSPKRGM